MTQFSTSQQYPMTLVFEPSAGSTIGTSSYPTLQCKGVLRLNEVLADSIKFTEHITEGTGVFSGCTEEVPLTARYMNRNRIFVTFETEGQIDGEATLSRVR
jgi:hypothetical protein